jgi:Na+-transporting NADH:ubiquinone oxidoreductase subunit NqrC
MFGSNALEVATGIVFIFLLLSLICSVINEGIAAALEQRGKNLLEGIKNLLNDPEFTSLAQHVYNHGLIDGVMQGATDFTKTNRLPSYIAPTNFALALTDILGSQGSGQAAVEQKQRELEVAQKKSAAAPEDEALKKAVSDAQAALERVKESAADLQKKYDAASEAAKKVKELKDFGRIKEASETLQSALAAGRALAAEYPDPLGSIQKGIEALSPGRTKQSLLVLLDKTKREVALVSKDIQIGAHAVEKLRGNLENWFNDAMDRFAGWYKRWTRQISFAVAIIVVGIANADTIMLANRLARDGALRAAIVAAADGATQKMSGDPSNVQNARQQLLEESEKLNLPLGWIDPKVNEIADPFEFERIPSNTGGWALKVFGLLLSALAVSLGAPFWFDTLSKFMNVRGAGKVPAANRSR